MGLKDLTNPPCRVAGHALRLHHKRFLYICLFPSLVQFPFPCSNTPSSRVPATHSATTGSPWMTPLHVPSTRSSPTSRLTSELVSPISRSKNCATSLARMVCKFSSEPAHIAVGAAPSNLPKANHCVHSYPRRPSDAPLGAHSRTIQGPACHHLAWFGRCLFRSRSF